MRYGLPAVERAMKMQEIVLRAMSGTISWLQAADILGLSPRTVRRWRARYERQGYDGLLDRRHGRAWGRRGALGGGGRAVRLSRERAAGARGDAALQRCAPGPPGRGPGGEPSAAGPPSAAPGAPGVCRRDAAPRWQSACVAGPGAGRAPDA